MQKERLRRISARERLNRAVRKIDEVEWRARQDIRDGADNVLSDPNATAVELVSEVIFIIGQRAVKWPVAIIAGVEEFFKKG
ncbi:hypothetical protein KJZ67_05330 [Patescibacteria group bacterium]|nr:hypothetical protein [Patescibacteria group bacterium]